MHYPIINSRETIAGRAGRQAERRKMILYFILTFFILFIFVLLFQGKRGLWEPDEGRYANIALNMLHSHNFLVPYLNNEIPHFGKPPLAYWAIAGSMRLFGLCEWAVRLPGALAFCITSLLIFALGRRLLPEKPWLPMAIYATSILPFAAANVANTDTLLVFWMTLAVSAFIFALWSDNAQRRRVLLDIMWAGFGLAFMTKGYPGLLPLLAIFTYIFVAERDKGIGWLFIPEGVMLFFVIGFGWYILMIVRDHSLLTYFVKDELFYRISTAIYSRNSAWYMPFAIYLPVLLFGSFPWTALLLRRPGSLLHLLRIKYWQNKMKKDPDGFFLLLWFLMPLAIFFVSRSRLPLYVLPAFAPLSLIIARRLDRVFDISRWPAKVFIISLVALLLTGKALLSLIPYDKDSRAVAHAIKNQVGISVDELVFVDKDPYYGLRFYTGHEVERVSVYKKAATDRHIIQEEPLERELKGWIPRKNPLFLVPERNLYAFDGAVAGLGYSTIARGYYHIPGHAKLYFFTLKKDS